MWRLLAVMLALSSACATCDALSPLSAAVAPRPSRRHSDFFDYGHWPSALMPFLAGGLPDLTSMLTHHLPALYAPRSRVRPLSCRWGFLRLLWLHTDGDCARGHALLSIPVDVAEKADSFELHASLPGVPKENVQVRGFATVRFSSARIQRSFACGRTQWHRAPATPRQYVRWRLSS